MRVLIAVTHLLGAGHLTRAAALARAFASAGHEAVLVSGGLSAALVRCEGVRLVQLPALQVRGTEFGRLLDAEGGEAEAVLLDARRRTLLDALDAAAPDVVVTELFPFGRRALAGEFLALVEAARARRPRPLVLASIRDILVAPDKPAKVDQAHDRIVRLYDAVLVHGDPRLAALDASWPVDPGLSETLHYTGYVDEGATFAKVERGGVVVAAGSSAAGIGLLRAAAGAARLRPDLGWRLLAGHGVPEDAFAAVGEGLPTGVLSRARSDYRALLARAAVSVSPCGYNTAVDLLAAGPRAVLVPFEAGRETEQRLRAERLAARGLARVLAEADLRPDTLLDAVTAALAGPLPGPHGIDLDGAARSVAIVERMLAQPALTRGIARSGRREHRDPPFDRLRAALDAVAERGDHIPLWWRDDDAVAAGPALDRLLGLAADHGIPILIAAIPADTRASLAERITAAPGARLAVHGLAHADHAPPGAKPAEFGLHRPLPVLLGEAEMALRLARERLPAEALLPVFVPPWNRFDPGLGAALPGLGYTGLSAAAERQAPARIAGLVRADVHLDPIDWRGTRSLADPDTLVDGLVDALSNAAARPVGLLTHHRVHDAGVWDFLGRLLPVLFGHPATRVLDPRRIFRADADTCARPISMAVQPASVS